MQPADIRHHHGLARLISLLVASCMMLALASGAVAQQGTGTDDDVVAISVTLMLGETLDEGRVWVDEEGLHVRDLTTDNLVGGDLSGNARLVTDIDWAGPCDPSGLVCEGGQDAFSLVEIESEAGNWSGTVAVEAVPDGAVLVHGVLVGWHGAADQVIVLSELTGADEAGLTFSGQLVTLNGPVGGIHLSHSACVTGENTADGGFIGSNGLVNDNGPDRIRFEPIGFSNPSGVYGEANLIGQKGILRGIFIAAINNQHAHGNFVLAGASGPYAGMLGYGRATMSLVDEPRCASGVQFTSTWTGQVRFLSDPEAFLAARVFFVSPADGAEVNSPVALELGAEHVVIEPAGEARDGAGYLNVIVDAPCIGPGELMPEDDQHIRLAGAETSLELSLLTGEHRLCVQLSDGAGVAQPATDVITIRVVPSDGGEGL
jgi:hypothetical protein